MTRRGAARRARDAAAGRARDDRRRRWRGRSSGSCATPQTLARLVAEIDAGESEDYLHGGGPRDAARAPGGAARRAHAAPGRCSVGGHELPAGTRVVPSIYLTNRNPRVYERPAGVPPRALPRQLARDVLLDPVRRRHPPLHRRVVRAAGDEADPAHGAARARAERSAARRRVAPRRVASAGARSRSCPRGSARSCGGAGARGSF